jgi:hypothetical protein
MFFLKECQVLRYELKNYLDNLKGKDTYNPPPDVGGKGLKELKFCLLSFGEGHQIVR